MTSRPDPAVRVPAEPGRPFPPAFAAARGAAGPHPRTPAARS